MALIDPFLGGSHLAWASGFAAASRHDLTVFGHDAMFWKWRMRGAHVTLAEEFDAAGGTGAFDVVVATGMLDVAAFQGLLRGRRIPTVLYLHETQFTYPAAPGERVDETYPMINWVSALAAAEVWFNSSYHFDAVFEGLPGLLKRFPDHRHGHLLETVRAKSRVLPVGVDLARLAPPPRPRRSKRILWNHRWEHDKAPEEFVALVDAVTEHDADIRLVLTGERIGDSSAALLDLVTRHADRIDVDGHLEREAYLRAVASSDVVVSTARQEFFGIALTEAMAAGVFPVVPNALVYPERIPGPLHDRCCYADRADAVNKVIWAVDHPAERWNIGSQIADAVAPFDWATVAPLYDDNLDRVVTRFHA